MTVGFGLCRLCWQNRGECEQRDGRTRPNCVGPAAIVGGLALLRS
ncbi:hypothetical protein ACWD3I_46895 [Streptomyces sp. NPDC002817]